MLLGSVPTPPKKPEVLDQYPVGQAEHGARRSPPPERPGAER